MAGASSVPRIAQQRVFWRHRSDILLLGMSSLIPVMLFVCDPDSISTDDGSISGLCTYHGHTMIRNK